MYSDPEAEQICDELLRIVNRAANQAVLSKTKGEIGELAGEVGAKLIALAVKALPDREGSPDLEVDGRNVEVKHQINVTPLWRWRKYLNRLGVGDFLLATREMKPGKREWLQVLTHAAKRGVTIVLYRFVRSLRDFKVAVAQIASGLGRSFLTMSDFVRGWVVVRRFCDGLRRVVEAVWYCRARLRRLPPADGVNRTFTATENRLGDPYAALATLLLDAGLGVNVVVRTVVRNRYLLLNLSVVDSPCMRVTSAYAQK